MRTYGRDATGQWVEVSTDATGDNSAVWLTTLCQALKLGLGESPFWGNYGVPAQKSVVTQVQPDFYILRTQNYFAQYFASLIVSKTSTNPPTYNISATLFNGVQISTQVIAQ